MNNNNQIDNMKTIFLVKREYKINKFYKKIKKWLASVGMGWTVARLGWASVGLG